MKKERNNVKNVVALSLSATMAALSTVLLYIGSIIEVLDLSLLTLTSFIIAFVAYEIGGVWPYLVYIVTGLLSMLLLPTKFVAIVYLVFSGLYPLAKGFFEKLPFLPRWILKLLAFNLEYVVIYLFIKHLFLLEETWTAFDDVTCILFNIVFVVYDIAMTKVMAFYFVKLRKYLGFDKIKK